MGDYPSFTCSYVAPFGQCRVNANRGPWQLFAQAPLLTRDKDLSQPATRVDTTCWQLFRPVSIRPIFIFCCCISYVKLLDYWRAEKNFSRPTSGGPLRPEARGICHMANPALRLATVRGRMRVSLNCWRNLGQFPHLPEYRGTRRGNESNRGILKLHHTPTHHNIGLPTSRPFAGSEI